jgi:hypothetical protein
LPSASRAAIFLLMPDIVPTTLNAKFSHAASGRRCLNVLNVVAGSLLIGTRPRPTRHAD